MKKNDTVRRSIEDKLPKVKTNLIILVSIIVIAVLLLIAAVIYSHIHPGGY
jgi:hypothetical protein